MSKNKGKKRKVSKEKNAIIKPKTRKDIRKEERVLKKQRKRDYFNKSSHVGRYVRAPEPDSDENEDNTKCIDLKEHPSTGNVIVQENLGAKKREQKLRDEMKNKRNDQLTKANKEEDKIINKLEKQLKLKKKPGIAKSFVEDGLGYLLEVCDEKTMSAAIAAEKHMADTGSASDFEEDLAIATGKTGVGSGDKNKQTKRVSKESDEESQSDESLQEDYSDEEFDNFSDESQLEEGEMFDDSDLEESELMEEDEEEEELMHSGMSHCHDDSFQPGNLTPITEETDQELNSYLNNLEIEKNVKEPLENVDEMDSDENNIIESESEESTSHSHVDMEACDSEEEHIDSSEESYYSDFESDGSECSNPECFSDEEDTSVDHIIVNGKIINTYGRQIPDSVEPDFERCPELDQILANISDHEDETQLDKKFAVSVSKRDEDSEKSSKKRKLASSVNDKAKKKSKIDDDECSSNVKSKKKTEPDNSKKKVENKKQHERKKIEIENEHSDFSLDDSESMSDEESSLGDDRMSDDANDGIWEDIYGKKRDKDGNIVIEASSRYVPPHLRGKNIDDDSADLAQLKRQIKGLLNKVAGSNMHWTSSQMESIYSSHSRHSVNNAFCWLWLSALVQPTITPDRMATEHAMLVAVLHANVGSEVGAHFLQTIVKKFNEMLNENQHIENKEMDNLILALSQLYNFKIFQASLLYEILSKLFESLSEKSIECILVALRNVGGVLRKEDPSALKAFIHSTQEKAGLFKQGTTDGSRIKFLLDVLMAIKNNNMNKIPNYDPSYAEELKKALKATIRRGNYIVPLNIKLDDLLKADERGKWWVVGSAWEGSSRQDKEQNQNSSNKNISDKSEAYLLDLAKKQRINTDLRRNIFCAIMSAEDCMDAFEKLQQLGLKSQQQKEIIHVLLSCCLQEKTYNPYYAVLAQKFCDYDRKFQLSIQFSVWDKLKEIDSCAPFQIANLAQFLTHLFNEKGIPISILKIVQFSDLTKSTLRLMRQILLGIILQKNNQTCLEVFQRVAISPKLHMFREGLKLFISHFLIKNSDKKERVLGEDEMSLLKERAASVTKVLSSDSKLQF